MDTTLPSFSESNALGFDFTCELCKPFPFYNLGRYCTQVCIQLLCQDLGWNQEHNDTQGFLDIE